MAKDKEVSGTIKEPEKKKVPKQETVNIIFRQNRKFDLHVGRDMITFRGRESKPIPKSWLKHSDFLQSKKLFIVKGV
jgi:hypothetical protein